MKLLIIEAPGKLKKLQPMMKKLRPGEDWQVVELTPVRAFAVKADFLHDQRFPMNKSVTQQHHEGRDFSKNNRGLVSAT